MTQSSSLDVFAGDRALARVRDQGLSPADVHIIPGAAGGPKALGLQGLDRVLFGEWLPRAPQPRALIGSSIGSWRFACVAQPDPVAALERLGDLYTRQRFPKGIKPAEVTRRCQIMLEEVLDGQQAHILSQPHWRLQVVVAQSRGLLRADDPLSLALGMIGVIAANTVRRPWLRAFLERVIVHDPRQAPPLSAYTDMPGRHAPLSEDNLAAALLASGSIPGVMTAVPEIPGVAGRHWRDGGLVDYHLDLPYETDGVVLYPHFTDRVIPGWFDKALSWRQADRERLRDVVLLAPSPQYLATLPDGKLPDRKDFTVYEGDDPGREKAWRSAMDASRRLGDDFLDLVETGRIQTAVRPLFEG